MKRKRVNKHSFVKNTVKPKEIKRLLMQPAGYYDGCTAWRMDWLNQSLKYSRKAVIDMSCVPVDAYVPSKNRGEFEVNPLLIETDALMMQRPVLEHHVKRVEQYKHVSEKMIENNVIPPRIIIDIDDIVASEHIPKFNFARKDYADNKRFENLKTVVNMSDEFHVCSEYMVEYYKDAMGFDKVIHRPNLMPKSIFDGYFDINKIADRFEKNKKKPRILWIGSWSHIDRLGHGKGEDDFHKLEKFIKSTLDDYQWIFFGAFPMWLSSEVAEGKVEFLEWVSVPDFPQKMLSLEPSLVIAPLADNTFNKAKSNIKLTEAGALGIAGVYQNLDPYKDAPLKFDTTDEMADQIKYLLSDFGVYKKVVSEMREYAEDYFIENNFRYLQALFFTPEGSYERQINPFRGLKSKK